METSSFLENNVISKEKTKLKPGYIYDERMLKHQCFNSFHNERPERLISIHTNLIDKDLLKYLNVLETDYINDDNLLLIHKSNHIKRVDDLKFEKDTKNKRDENSHGYSLCYDSFDNYYTSYAARLAANSVIVGIDNLMNNKIDGAFLVVRPPGHHAYPEIASGFCFYNNVAIGAKYALKQYNLKRIAIVDWDVHHGNGTQEIFYDSNEVLFISFHRFEKGLFYPFVKGNFNEIGENDGKGFNINIPFNTRRLNEESIVGDEEYIYAFNTIVSPILKEFNPELILVSCGFDAAKGDPLGKLSITPFGYSYLINGLREIVGKNLIVVLEGGYNLKSLSTCSEAIVKALIGEKMNFEIDSERINYEDFSRCMRPAHYTIREINEIKYYFKRYWKSLQNIENMIYKNSMFYTLDNKSSIEKLMNLYPNLSDYFLKDYTEIESFLEGNDFIKFKIGKYSYLNKSNIIKYLKHLLVANRSGSYVNNFRIESISISKYFMNWSKYETNLDFYNENHIKNLIFLGFEGKQNLILEKLESLIIHAEKLIEIGIDLINLDLFVIKGRENILIKLNNLKNYSIVDFQSKIFMNGLRSLATLFKSFN